MANLCEKVQKTHPNDSELVGLGEQLHETPIYFMNYSKLVGKLYSKF